MIRTETITSETGRPNGAHDLGPQDPDAAGADVIHMGNKNHEH